MKEYTDKWKNSVSGRLYSFLQSNYAHEGTIEVFDPGSLIEIFSFNNEEAHMWRKASFSDDTIDVVLAIESFEYKRLLWWKEAVDSQQRDIFEFLDPPISWVAKDAGIKEWESLYKPSTVLKELLLDQHIDQTVKEKSMNEIRRAIAETLNPLVSPHYAIAFQDLGLRMIALSDEAIESRYGDNEVYADVLSKIKETPSELRARYSQIR